MRKFIFVLIACCSVIASFGQVKNIYLVNGKIQGLKNDTTVYLILNYKGDTIASTTTRNGKFTFKGQLANSPDWASVRIAKATKWPTFFLENKKVTIKGSLEEWPQALVTGSPETENLDAFKKKLKPLQDAYAENNKTVSKDTTIIKEVMARNKELQDSMELARDNYISTHPNSVYTAWLIKNTARFDAARRQQEYDKLTPVIQQSFYGLQLKDNIKEMVLRNTIKPGAISPDFKLQTPGGELFSLNEVVSKSKLTLLDFWASWCAPCRDFTPELKKLYAEFHDKGFNILSISSDKNKDAWKKAIADDGMNWLHGMAVEGYENPSGVYDIQAIPAMVLLDETGKIIAIKSAMSSVPSFGLEGKDEEKALYEKVAGILRR